MGNMGKVEMTSQDTHIENNGAVDKIRDLLFGSQMDSYDQNFEHLESLIANESKTLSDKLTKRLMTFETAFNQRIETTEKIQEQERKERITAIDMINSTVQQNFVQLHDQLQNLEANATQSIEDVKILLEQQAHGLTSQIQILREQFNQSLNDQATQLDAQTIKRQKLADLLSEASKQLKHD